MKRILAWLMSALLALTCLSINPNPVIAANGNGSSNRKTPLEQVWYSGSKERKFLIDFSTAPPKVTCGLPVGQSDGNEGTANFTDPVSGELKLYTDGRTVFNGKSNQPLANGTGLNGNPTATEAAMIVPVPGKDSQFYIFTNSSKWENSYDRKDGSVSYLSLIFPVALSRVSSWVKPLWVMSTMMVNQTRS